MPLFTQLPTRIFSEIELPMWCLLGSLRHASVSGTMLSGRLFVEAKDLGKDLSDRKWISQILGYATVVGAEWCVLTNGDEYRISIKPWSWLPVFLRVAHCP